jgi:hypothetical protein
MLVFLEAKFISGYTVRIVGYTEQTKKERRLLLSVLKNIKMSLAAVIL